jgi:hypothetical protein
MRKRIILTMLFIGVGLAACQMNPLFPESTPIIIPTRLVLPTPTGPAGSSLPSPSPQPLEPTSDPHALATLTVPPSLPSPTPQPVTPTHLGKYSRRARGIELNDTTGKVDPTKLQADFGVVYGGSGWADPFPNYGDNLLALDQANIPCLLLWDILLPPDFDASRPDQSFPPENEEPNVAAIIKATRGKAVAGIIIRFLDKDMPNHKIFTQGWMANYIPWMVKAVHNQTDKPTFVMTSQAFISGFGDAPDLNRVISGLDGISSWKSALPGQTPQSASWNDFPFPGDNYVPEYVSDNGSLDFINFARTAWKFDGIDAPSTPLWLYTGSAAQLKKNLDYKDHALNPPVNPTPTVSG